MKDRKILTIFMVLFLVLNLFSPLVNSGSTIEAQEVSTSEDSVSSSDNSNQSKQILNKDELASTTKSEGEETTVAQEVTSATEQVEEVSKLYSSSTELNTSIKDATETSQEPSEETSVFGDLEKEKIIHDSIIMPATFVFHKTDEFGEPLQGAVFALQDLAGNIIKAVSDEEGKVSFENLKKRYYVLSEIEAPYNYALNKQKYYLTFDDQNNVIIGNEAPRNINSLIENVDFSFEKFLEMYSTSNPERGDYAVSKKDIYPNAPTDHFKTSIRFNINHPVKPGDYFDLVLDDNLKFGYISPNSVKAPDLLLEGTQDILATVDYLAAFNTFRYSFTNIVSPEGKTVENAKINLGIVGIDREKVKYNKDDLTFTNHIGTTEMVSEPFNIIYDLRRPDYGNYYVDGDSYTPSIGTVIKELNEDEDFIDYRIYLNPANQEIYTNGYLDLFGGAINGVTSSYVTENSPITIYKVYPNQFVPSYGMETTNLEDVTSNFETYFIENDGTNRGYYRELNDLMRIRFTEDDFKKGIGYLIDIRLKASEENMAQYKAMALWVNSDQISDMGITTGHGWTLNQVPSGASAIAPKFTPRDLVISNSLEATTTVETTEEPTTVETSEATTTVETTEEPTTVETSEVTTTVATTEESTTVETSEATTTVETTEEPTTVETSEVTTTVATAEEPTTVETSEATTTVATTEEPTTVETSEATTTVETTEEPTTVETSEVTTTVATTEEPTTVETSEATTTVETTEELTTVETSEVTTTVETTEEPTTVETTDETSSETPSPEDTSNHLPPTGEEKTVLGMLSFIVMAIGTVMLLKRK